MEKELQIGNTVALNVFGGDEYPLMVIEQIIGNGFVVCIWYDADVHDFKKGNFHIKTLKLIN
jgi:uncharacterized protein YodC (DUF2158 family)